ncbi:hypothetical protein ACHAQA_009355 [Verticillium albo-atrum]
MHTLDFGALLACFALVQQTSAVLLNPRSASWDQASTKARDFIGQLSLEEKIGLVTGGYSTPGPPCVGSVGPIERLGFKGICYSDGPAGYARADGVSVFASGITAAASWDPRLIYERALAIGEEFKEKGAHVHLGPSSGPMGRHALGGRNWESFSPDPYLSGIAMNASVVGIQTAGVQACSKHFVGNEQELQRTPTTLDDGTVIEAISSNIDNRTLHELYLWPFASAVKAGTASVMCAYSRINGLYSCGSSDMLSVLKDEMAFPGYVVSDWQATHATEFANAGLDLEMPGNVSVLVGPSFFGNSLLEAVENGTVQEIRLDEMAERVLRPYFLLGQDEDFPEPDPSLGPAFARYQYGHAMAPIAFNGPAVRARDVRGDHAKLIREMGAAATVLLKNVNGTLPLKKDLKEIGVFGNGAPYPTIGSVNLDYGGRPISPETGAVYIGGGSGTVRHTDLVTPLEAVQRQVREHGCRVQVLMDNNDVADGRFRNIYPVPDVCLVFLKAFATEGQDRESLELDWNSTMVVEATAALCPNTIVVMHGPGIVLMPWADNENVTAILSAHYPGDQTGNSVVDVLWGATPPSGRLPYTIPRSLADYGAPIVNVSAPVTDPNAWQANFTEGQMIDYRHFDANDIEPLYEFGFGLSYAEFEIAADIEVSVTPELRGQVDESKGKAPGGWRDLWTHAASASISVTNTGSIAGSTVSQLYVAFPQSSTPQGTPLRVLRGFEKVYLEPGESTMVVFDLKRRDLSFWSEESQGWEIPTGAFKLSVGFSSRDLKAEAEVAVLN